MIPCWIVCVTGRNEGGRIHVWRTTPMSLTDAWFEQASYARMGHRARIECDERLVDLERLVRSGEIDGEEAQFRASELGYGA